MAGLLALWGSEFGQIRKEAATAIFTSAGGVARHQSLYRLLNLFLYSFTLV